MLPGPVPSSPRQDAVSSLAQGAFPRRMPARLSLARKPRAQTRHRARRFAPACRLPMLFCPSLLDQKEGLDLVATEGSSPTGARRHAPLVDFCNRNDPQARPSNRLNPVAIATAGFRRSWLTLGSLPLSGVRGRGLPGQGLVVLWLSPSPAPFGTIARTEGLAPTRSDSDTSCRKLGIRIGRRADGIGRSCLQARLSPRSRRGLACARPAGPLPAPLREEEMRSAAPEVPSIVEPPRRGGPLSTSCPQAVEYGPVPLQPPLVPFL